MKIIGVGETVLDMVFRDSKVEAAVPGGSTFNAMISLGRTVRRDFPQITIGMATQMGDDPLGGIITSFMKDNGVSTDYVAKETDRQSTLSIAMLDSQNNASYEFFRDSAMPLFKAPVINFEPGDILLFGSFFAVSPSTRDSLLEIVHSAREAGAIIYYDINFRKSHKGDYEKIKSCIIENCALSDIVRGSDEDIELVFGSSDPAKVYSENLYTLCRNFICTKGKRPAEVFSEGVTASFDVLPIKTVTTIGAGDNFNAGVVYSLVKENISKSNLRQMSVESWSKLIPVAMKFSANVCQSIYNYVDKDFRPF